MQSLGAFLQCYKEPLATYKCLESFRSFYPDSSIVLLSDNGYDYSEMAKHFHCIYIHSTENIVLSCHKKENQYQINHMKKLLNRINMAFQLCNEDYIMWLEDDVIINHKITDTFQYDMNGFCPNTILQKNFIALHHDYPFINDINKCRITGHGGSVFHKNKMVQYFNNTLLVDDLLSNYNKYMFDWNQDILFSVITVLNGGTIGSYEGHFDCNILNPYISVQHQYKRWYGVEVPDELKHLVKI